MAPVVIRQRSTLFFLRPLKSQEIHEDAEDAWRATRRVEDCPDDDLPVTIAQYTWYLANSIVCGTRCDQKIAQQSKQVSSEQHLGMRQADGVYVCMYISYILVHTVWTHLEWIILRAKLAP